MTIEMEQLRKEVKRIVIELLRLYYNKTSNYELMKRNEKIILRGLHWRIVDLLIEMSNLEFDILSDAELFYKNYEGKEPKDN